MTSAPVPAEVLDAFELTGDRLEAVAGGLINQTFLARDEAGAPALVLQRLHAIFAGEVNLDIEAVTEHVAARGLETPRLVRAADGRAWVDAGGAAWRVLTYVGGVTLHAIEDAAQAEEAGALVGRFHRAVDDLDRAFAFARADVHDTAAHLARLSAVTTDATSGPLAEAAALRDRILEAAAALPAMPATRRRICHGDLKVSNLRFDHDRRRARALIDLDTLGWQTIAYELGDALRSWCNPRGEDTGEPSIDLGILRASLRGYARGAGDLLSAEERASVAVGLETVCVELAARFCTDVFDDSYFGWDGARFASRREHNLVRARGQLALAASVTHARDAIRDAVA